MVLEQFNEVLAALPRLTDAQLHEVRKTIEKLQAPAAPVPWLTMPPGASLPMGGVGDELARPDDPCQAAVLELMLDGLSNPDIAQRLQISRHAAKVRVSAILQRMGLRTRGQAIAQMRREQARALLGATEQPVTHGVSMSPDELGLTPRQGSLLLLMLEGLSNKLIAARLGLGENTVKEYVSAILRRLGLRNRAELIARMKRVSVREAGGEPCAVGEVKMSAHALEAPRAPVTLDELGLTRRQGRVLALLLDGMSNKAIGRSLGLSENTVKEHVSAILQRVGVRSRAQVISRMMPHTLQAE